MTAPYTIIEIAETTSTNEHIRRLHRENPLPEGTTVSADFQTKGRGQMGNSWESEPEKNLLFSILLFPTEVKINEQFVISQLVAVSLQAALESYLTPITIKWPNDIYYGEQKLAGILIENDLRGEKMLLSVVGIGVNVNQERFYSDAPNPVSLLQLLGTEVDRRSLLTAFLAQLALNYALLNSGKVNDLADRYHAVLFRGEGLHLFRDESGVFSAQIEKVDTAGFLHLVTDTRERRKYFFKEVSFVLDL